MRSVSEAKECMMPVGNLAKVFGPTLVGYSVSDPEPQMLLQQTTDQQNVSSNVCQVFLLVK
jgi:Rac GTPase-activating protein 1